jgi:NAD(P)H dehydrogenase (quinone)
LKGEIKMKVSVVFHSVTGNTYLMAREIHQDFIKRGIEAKLYRVKDEDLMDLAKEIPIISEYLDEIVNVPIAEVSDLLDSDYLFMGSPTYFGNVSGDMKAFMDSFAPYWTDAKFFGKRLVAFATSGTAEGGGDVCLRAINTFGQHMGMVAVPMPANLVPGMAVPAYGLLHYSGDNGDKRIGQDIKKAVDNLVELVVKGI